MHYFLALRVPVPLIVLIAAVIGLFGYAAYNEAHFQFNLFIEWIGLK